MAQDREMAHFAASRGQSVENFLDQIEKASYLPLGKTRHDSAYLGKSVHPDQMSLQKAEGYGQKAEVKKYAPYPGVMRRVAHTKVWYLLEKGENTDRYCAPVQMQDVIR